MAGSRRNDRLQARAMAAREGRRSFTERDVMSKTKRKQEEAPTVAQAIAWNADLMGKVFVQMGEHFPEGGSADLKHATNDEGVHYKIAHLIRQRAAFAENVFPVTLRCYESLEHLIGMGKFDQVDERIHEYDFGYVQRTSDRHVRLSLVRVPQSLWNLDPHPDVFRERLESPKWRLAGFTELLFFAWKYPIVQEYHPVFAVASSVNNADGERLFPYLYGGGGSWWHHALHVSRCVENRVSFCQSDPHVLVVLK